MATNSSPAIAAPTSMDEVEQLVKQLYTRGNPARISQIDDELKRLQHSKEGWQLADALLASQDQNVRFYALLTFQIKLNNDGAKLDVTTAQAVLTRLVSWATRLDQVGEGRMIRKKLCAALGTYFLRSPIPWTKPLLHLAASFRQGDAVSEDQLPAARDALSLYLPLLTESQLITMLWLSGQLATDAAKVDSTSPASALVHELMEVLVSDAATLMRHVLNQPATPQSVTFKVQCLACFVNWIDYAQPMWPTKPEALAHLRSLVSPLSALLTDPDDVLQNEAMDVFRDVLENYTSFLQQPQMAVLSAIIRENIQPRLLQGLQNSEPEVYTVAQLVIAFGIASIQQIVEKPEEHMATLQLILAILQSAGYPGEDDEVSVHSIEFWNTYIEYINDVTYTNTTTGTKQIWIETAKVTCATLTSLLWRKMRTPDSETAKEWTEEASDAFREFRMDASDLMLSIYVFLGKDMLQQLVNLALTALQAQNWQELEAAMFCVNNLADNVLEDQYAEELLLPIFQSHLFRTIGDFSQDVPSQARRTAVDTLGAYGQFVERHAEFLPVTLRFLFASLENPTLCLNASKSIAGLCSTCRNSLTGDLPGFLEQYNRFAQSETSEPYTNEKVIGAIAAIVQAVHPEDAKAGPLSSLLDIIDSMIANAQRLTDPEMAETIAVSSIDCLAAIGKNLQTEDDAPIDLYEDGPPPEDNNNFWLGLQGQALQIRIISSCTTVLDWQSSSGQVVEAVTKVLKSGFTESQPGPFVFAPSMTTGFLQRCTPTTPNVESVLAMTCTLIIQYSRQDHRLIGDEIRLIYDHMVSFAQALDSPSQDPSIAQCCIDVCHRMIPRYMDILLDVSGGTGDEASVRAILDFTLKAIDGRDLLPKRTAADFWTSLFKPPTQPSNPIVRTRLEQVQMHYGPQLAQALMNQVSGGAQRSELEKLCEPLKALIQTQPRAKGWFEQALIQNNAGGVIENPSVGDGDKRKFVQALVSLRGETRKTRELVKNFYAICRGTVVSFS